MIKLDVAVLVGLVMQAFMNGIFQVSFVACLYVLLAGRFDQTHWPFLFTTIVMWILICVNFSLSWSRIMDAFIDLQPAFRSDPEAIVKYFSNLGHWKEVTRTACYLSLTAVADTLFIYRLYIVWGRMKYIVILPMLLLCGSITAGVAIEIVLCTSTPGLFGSKLAVWATSFFITSLVQNISTTLLIVYRIWRVNVGVAPNLGGRSLWPVIAVLLESGAIYSTALLVLLATYLANSFSQYIALDILVPIMGITFNLIIVRVGLGLSHNGLGGRNQPSTQTSLGTFPLQKLNINVSHQVTAERDVEQQDTHETKIQAYPAAELDDDPQWKRTPVAI